jgi:hypothetical protein
MEIEPTGYIFNNFTYINIILLYLYRIIILSLSYRFIIFIINILLN